MSRLIRRPIEVLRTLGPAYDEAPAEFIDQGVRRRVAAIIDRWAEMGAWWEGEGQRYLFRIQTEDMAVMDVERTDRGEWFVYRVWD